MSPSIGDLPRPPDPIGPVDYSSLEVPPSYHCHICLVQGIKLWRNPKADERSLLCGACAGAEQGCTQIIELPDGRVSVGKDGGAEIGSRVPAIPREDGNGFHEYMSAPAEAKDWWLLIPLDTETIDADPPYGVFIQLS